MIDAGYSGTPLARKLGVRAGAVVLLIGAPDAYPSWLHPLPDDVSFTSAPTPGGADIVHLFVSTVSDLDAGLPQARAAMKVDGAVWVSWPKRTSKIPTDVTEGLIRARALAGDLVDVKVCAVTDVWSGLKLVVRKALR